MTDTTPTPDDNAIRAAIEVRYRLTTQWVRAQQYFRVDDYLWEKTPGLGDDGVDAAKDWAARNGVEWRLPE